MLIDSGWAQFGLDAAKSIHEGLASIFGAKDGRPAVRLAHNSPNAYVGDKRENNFIANRKTNVTINQTLIIAHENECDSMARALPNASEANQALLEALANDSEKSATENSLGLLDGFEEEVSLKRLQGKKRGDGVA